jgi:hypothetical protein
MAPDNSPLRNVGRNDAPRADYSASTNRNTRKHKGLCSNHGEGTNRKLGAFKPRVFFPFQSDFLATAIIDFASEGIRPTRRKRISAKPASFRSNVSVRIDQNLMCPLSQSTVK